MKKIVINSNEVFRKALDELGISADAYAVFAGKSRSTIFKYLNNERQISDETLINIFDLLSDNGIDVIKLLGIEDEDDYFYHATDKEITFPINVHLNDERNHDFGYGFYLGENLKQSSTWGKLGHATIIYRFKRDKFNCLNVLDFDNRPPLDWLNYVAINRHKLKYELFPKFFVKYKKLEAGIGLIKGKIADFFSYEVLEKLYKDQIDIDQAEYATTMMALGKQYCLKDEEFAKSLQPDEMIIYDEALSRCFLKFANRNKDKQTKNVELILKAIPNQKRLFSNYVRRQKNV